MQLVRRLLLSDGQLSEPLVRTAAARLAEYLAGGKNGYSWNYGEARGKGYDPEGCFATVTEGRQCRWKGPDGKWHAYSACEDLHGAVWLRVLGLPPLIGTALGKPLDWCNRVEAGKKWRAQWNLRSLQHYRGGCWRRYHPGTEWDALPGDAVQIIGRHGGHTLVLLDVRYRDGRPVVCDTAEYGQYHQPEGAIRSDHSCLCRYDQPITDGPKGWHVRGRPVYGRASLWLLAQDVVAELDEVLPAWVPEGFTGGVEVDNPYLPEYADTDPAPPPDRED